MTQPAVNANEVALLNNLETTFGLTAAQAAGVAGNAQTESGFSTSASNPKEGAIGLFQWEGGRRTALDSLAQSMNLPETSITAQLAYLDQELKGPYAQALSQVKASSTAGTAAGYFNADFERSLGTVVGNPTAGASTPSRVANANAILGQFPGVAAGTTGGGGIGGVITGVGGAVGGGVGTVVGDVEGIITSPLAFLQEIYKGLTSPSTWLRVGLFVMGFIVVVIALDKISDGAISGAVKSTPAPAIPQLPAPVPSPPPAASPAQGSTTAKPAKAAAAKPAKAAAAKPAKAAAPKPAKAVAADAAEVA